MTDRPPLPASAVAEGLARERRVSLLPELTAKVRELTAKCSERDALIADLVASFVELAELFDRAGNLHPSRDLREVFAEPAGMAIRMRLLVAKARGQ